MPLGCDAHVGKVTLSLHEAAVPLDVAACVVPRLKTATCQAEPVQYCPSGRCSVNVVVFKLSPEPPVLSAALPLNVVGTVAAPKLLPFAGVVTDAVVGAVLSMVKVFAVPCVVAPPLSLADARAPYEPSAGATNG